MPARPVDAEDLHSRAVTAGSAGRHDEARRLLVRARAATDDVDLLARIDLTGAYVDAETGDAAGAMERCRSVLQEPATSPHVRGLAHSQLGLLWMRRSEHDRALAELSEAIHRLDEATSLAVAFLNRGNVHLQRAEVGSARADFAQAAEHYRAAEDAVGAAKAVFNQAYCDLLAGDLVTALQGMDEAGDVLSPLSETHAATVAQDRAEVLRAAGRVREAAASLEAAATAYGALGLLRYQAEAEFALAGTLLAEDPGRARHVARTSARRFARTGNTVWAARAEALTLVAELRAGRAPAGVPGRADDLAARLRAAGQLRDREQLALETTRLLVRRGELDEAAGRLRRLRLGRDAPVTLRLLARQARAELHTARGHGGRSRQQVRLGLHELHAWQASFGSLDLQSSLVSHGNGLARLGLRTALEDGTPDLVLEWSERARALAARVAPVRPPGDSVLAAELTELRTLGPDDARRRHELQDRIRQRHWYGEGSGDVGEPVTLAALREELAGRDVALLAHIVLDDRLHALVVTPEDIRVVPLGDAPSVRHLLDRVAADLDTAAGHRTGPLAEAVRASVADDLAAVADRLVGPVLGLIGDRRLVLTPSALLAGTPWTLLPGLKGRPLTVPQSATRWHRSVIDRAAEHGTGGHGPRVGLVAGPDVPRAAEELRRAAASWRRAGVLDGERATAEEVSRLATDVDLLHLAGHGRHAGEHPLFSAVRLHDGLWFGYDIDTLPRVPDLVVLSACELGRSSVRSAEETVGMTAAWLHAGTRTVLSSPVVVADETACDVLADWHRRVAAGAAPADALAEAVAAADDVAPFVCFGAGW